MGCKNCGNKMSKRKRYLSDKLRELNSIIYGNETLSEDEERRIRLEARKVEREIKGS